MENNQKNIKENLGSVIKVISYAMKNDKNQLIALLRRNGIELPENFSDAQLRQIVISSLRQSETFRLEFRDWVIERSGVLRNSKAKEILSNLPKPPKQIVDTLVGLNWSNPNTQNHPKFVSANGFVNPGFEFSENVLGSDNSSTSTSEVPSNDGGFWSGIDFNTILDFAGNQLNNYTTIVKSQADEAIMNNAVALEQSKDDSLNPNLQSSNKTKYILIGVGILSVIAISSYFVLKNKK